MTSQEMAALVPHPDWGDGREGFLWCRFDAVIRPEIGLRAEITWADSVLNGETIYTRPQLRLETNQLVTVGGHREMRTWETADIPLTEETAVLIATNLPADLLHRYAEGIAMLRIADPLHVTVDLDEGSFLLGRKYWCCKASIESQSCEPLGMDEPVEPWQGILNRVDGRIGGPIYYLHRFGAEDKIDFDTNATAQVRPHEVFEDRDKCVESFRVKCRQHATALTEVANCFFKLAETFR